MFAVVLCAAAAFVYALWRHGFPVALMDLDGSGFVSPAEAVESLDLGYRQILGHGRNCTQIYWLQDGTERKLICEGR
jgi:hypothetical protein